MLGRREMWQRFNNGDNLLFREEDFRNPGQSKLFRVLWKNMPDADARALLGRMVLACGTRLEAAPLLDEVVTDGKVLPLSSEQEAVVNALLAPPPGSPAKPLSADDIPLDWLMPPGRPELSAPVTAAGELLNPLLSTIRPLSVRETVPAAAETPEPRHLLSSVWGGLVYVFTRNLPRWVTLPLLLLVTAWIGGVCLLGLLLILLAVVWVWNWTRD